MKTWKKRRADRTLLWAALGCLFVAGAASAANPHTPANDVTHPTEQAAPGDLTATAAATQVANEKKKVDPLTDKVDLTMTFAIESRCRIIDPRHTLDEFWENLLNRYNGKDTVLSIVHLGDSHIQGGFYTNETMNLLRRTFGNAGRGWIAPYRPARENGPSDYRIFSQVKGWSVGRCTRPQADTPWGLGGMGLQTEAATIDFTIALNGAGDDFTRVLMYRGEHARPMLPEGVQGARKAWGKEACAPDLTVDSFYLPEAVRELHLQSVSRSEAPSGTSAASCYYGFSLTNGRPGVLYHAIGRNGATYSQYTAEHFVRQMAQLKPSILIISLGTNESYGTRFSASDFITRVDRFVQLARRHLPLTAIILSTPAENYLRTRTTVTRRAKGKKRRMVTTVTRGFTRNVHVGEAAEAILKYADREGLACFDLYGMTGGAGSCEQWQAEGLFSHDRVHYSASGYREQGKLLYKALVRSALDYQQRKGK